MAAGCLDILIAGAQKSATSSLFALLGAHPAVTPNLGGECMYYSDASEFARGARWADAKYFPGARSTDQTRATSLRLGKSVDVLPDAASHRRAALDNPDLQIVCVLRDPVDRAYSAYRWAVARGVDRSESFPVAIDKYGDNSTDGRPTHGNYLENGCYVRQLERLRDTFPESQTHILFYDDVTSGGLWIPRLLTSLNLPIVEMDTLPLHNGRHASRSQAAARVLAHRSSLRTALGEALPARARFKLISLLWRLNTRPASTPPLSDRERRRLSLYYAPFDRELSEFLGTPLPWRVATHARRGPP